MYKEGFKIASGILGAGINYSMGNGVAGSYDKTGQTGSYNSWYKSLNLWAGNKIAYLYIVLSPWIQQIAPMKLLEREMSFDSNLYLNQIDDSIRDYFKQEFAYEF